MIKAKRQVMIFFLFVKGGHLHPEGLTWISSPAVRWSISSLGQGEIWLEGGFNVAEAGMTVSPLERRQERDSNKVCW